MVEKQIDGSMALAEKEEEQLLKPAKNCPGRGCGQRKELRHG